MNSVASSSAARRFDVSSTRGKKRVHPSALDEPPVEMVTPAFARLAPSFFGSPFTCSAMMFVPLGIFSTRKLG